MSLDWSDPRAFQNKYFGLTPTRRLPAGWRSIDRQQWDAEDIAREQRDAALVQSHADHVR
jgi:hypothetical protein